jgi:nitrogen PTS system EIIA component
MKEKMREAAKKFIAPAADLSGVDAIMPDLRVSALPQVMQALAAQAGGDIRLPETYILDRLAAQEKQASSGIGNGVAIMHLRLRWLKQPYAVFARAAKPVAVSAVDNLPADLFLLLLSPAGDVSGHLRRLSRFSRLMRDGAFRQKLRAVDGRDGLHALFMLPEGQSAAGLK